MAINGDSEWKFNVGISFSVDVKLQNNLAPQSLV